MSWIYVSNGQGRIFAYLSSTCFDCSMFFSKNRCKFSYKYMCKGLKKLVLIVIVLLCNRSSRLCNFWGFCVPILNMKTTCFMKSEGVFLELIEKAQPNQLQRAPTLKKVSFHFIFLLLVNCKFIIFFHNVYNHSLTNSVYDAISIISLLGVFII